MNSKYSGCGPHSKDRGWHLTETTGLSAVGSFLSKSTSFSRSCTCRIRVEEFMRDPRLGERSGKFERRQLQGNVLSCTISPLVQQSPCSRDGVMSCRYFGG